MGLDMFACRASQQLVGDKQLGDELAQALFADGKPRPGVAADFAYWRNFDALHGWMDALYRRKGGTGMFNTTPVRLMPEDIDRLEAEIDSLVHTTGFFFGPQEYTDDDKQEVREFIARARVAFAEGDAVICDSSW